LKFSSLAFVAFHAWHIPDAGISSLVQKLMFKIPAIRRVIEAIRKSCEISKSISGHFQIDELILIYLSSSDTHCGGISGVLNLHFTSAAFLDTLWCRTTWELMLFNWYGRDGHFISSKMHVMSCCLSQAYSMKILLVHFVQTFQQTWHMWYVLEFHFCCSDFPFKFAFTAHFHTYYVSICLEQL
jgi:hypothetical protein